MSQAVAARPRLLILTIDCPSRVGGIQRIVHELGHHLTPRWQVTVIAPRDDRSRSYDMRSPFRIVRTRAARGSSPLGLLTEMTLLARGIAADVVLSAHANLMPALVAGGRGRPLMLMVYGSELWAPRTRVIARMLGSQMSLVMAISRFTAAEAAKAGLPSERIVMTPPGASVPAATSQEDELLENLGLAGTDGVAPFFLTVGRLTQPHKGQDMFIRAMPSLLRDEPRLRYVIAGEGPLGTELWTLAERLEVSHAVQLAGAVDEVTKGALLRKCRALVMTSRATRRPPLFEGFGIVYMEAGLAGRPSLAGRAGGAPDAVLDGQTGLLVDPTSLLDVTRGASRLLDADYADRLGRQARERASSEFTWERAVARFENCLQSVPR